MCKGTYKNNWYKYQNKSGKKLWYLTNTVFSSPHFKEKYIRVGMIRIEGKEVITSNYSFPKESFIRESNIVKPASLIREMIKVFAVALFIDAKI